MSRGLARMVSEATGRGDLDRRLEAPIAPPVIGEAPEAAPEAPPEPQAPVEAPTPVGAEAPQAFEAPEPDALRSDDAEPLRAVAKRTLQIVYHVEAVGPKGYLAAVRRVGWNDPWRYHILHYPTRMFLGVQFKNLHEAEDFMEEAEGMWDFSFRAVKPFKQYGISLEEIARLASRFNGADMFGNRIHASFDVGTQT